MPSTLRFLALALACFAFTATASAQWSGSEDTANVGLEARIRSARQAQLWGGGAGGALGLGLGVGLGYAAMSRCADGSEICPALSFAVIAPSTALIAIPSLTAGAVTFIGGRHDVDGSYAMTWLGSLGGSVVGIGTGVGLSLALQDPQTGFWLTPLTTLAGASAGAVLAHNRSARSRFARALGAAKPSFDLTDDRRGAMLTLSGTF